ncbi:hypothetical protein [Streptococcus tangpeifui]|uniref:hypothetical protein n=1 Tax=Streptococcus tangpeifui TaxID=2709400 RepID=UPI0013EE3472|nr:hypothetical protein [Streptococcus sp. ZJ373]
MTNNNAGLKKLAQANGLLGVIGGVISFICATLMVLAARGVISSAFMFLSLPALAFRIATLIMGIIGIVKFKGTNFVPMVAHIFFIIALPIGPLTAMIADIFPIIAGIIYLTSLKKFDQIQNTQIPNQDFQ